MPGDRKIPRAFTMHWGSGNIVEEAWITNEHHEPTVQLLEYSDGEAMGEVTIRFCSFREGRFQRSPLMISESDLGPLREAIAKQPRLHALLRRLVD